MTGSCRKPLVLATNADAGGANAIAPVIKRLRREALADIVLIGAVHSSNIFRQRKLPFQSLSELGAGVKPREQARVLLDIFRPDAILSGASWGETLEKFLWDEGRLNGIVSLAVLDIWSMYWQRFGNVSTGQRWTHLPDRIAVIDEKARFELVSLGLSRDRIAVTGQPHFDYLRQVRKRALNARAKVRTRLAIPPDSLMIVFASESHSADLGQDPSSPNYLGYTETGVLSELVKALERVQELRQQHLRLVVKLHPKEEKRLTGERLLGSKLTPFVQDFEPLQLAAAADVVVGMTSMFLIEASALGRLAISFQPIDESSDTMWSNRIGITKPAYNTEELVQLLRHCRTDPADKVSQNPGWGNWPPELGDGRATQRVIGELFSLLGHSSVPREGLSC